MSGLPLWLQIVGLAGGLLWPGYQLWLAVMGPSLKIKLTRDLFFRFIETGECIFIRPVLIPEHGNVLIKKVASQLKRVGPGASKEWDLEFLKFGIVVNNAQQVESNFCFESSSPIRFLSKGVPTQAVYLARPKGYGEEYAKILKEIREKLIPVRTEITTLGATEDEKKRIEINKKILSLAEGYSQKLFDKIQLEAGTYQICLTVQYRAISGIWSYFDRSTARTVLKFEIEDNAREQVKGSLLTAVHKSALNFATSSNELIVYPEYRPNSLFEENQ